MINFFKRNSKKLKLLLPPNHALPSYKDNNCYYDNLLPAIVPLCKNWIIDIGANIGDTLYSTIFHTKAKFLCIEPDKEFFNFLVKNVSQLSTHDKKRVRCENSFIVINTENEISLKKSFLGTAHRIEGEVDKKKSYINRNRLTLTEALNKHKIPINEIDLIKVDTDGYDYECLISLEEDLLNTNAVLYYENYLTTNEKQKNGFKDLVFYLTNMGYKYFFVFDNFGNYLAAGDLNLVLDLNNYLIRLNEKNTSRTFFYIDVLTCKEKYLASIKNIINKLYAL